MKAITYHYIRDGRQNGPGLRYLHHRNFVRQLDAFAATYDFVPRDTFLQSVATGTPVPSGVVLTFDDSLRDHVDFVLPELQRRGLWGIFYIPAGPYLTGKLLDVHRIHVLLGHADAQNVARHLTELVTPDALDDGRADAFTHATYQDFDDDASTIFIKRTLNYYVKPGLRGALVDALIDAHVDNPPGVEDYYIPHDKLALLRDAGMLLGSHGVSHTVMSNLSEAAQAQEISDSFAFLEDAIGELPARTFCYPYGGPNTFTPATEAMLTSAGCAFSFDVTPRDICDVDLRERPQALPRYDCNRFPFGAASWGHTPEPN